MTTTSHHMVPRSDIKEALDTSFYNVTPTHSTWEAECKAQRKRAEKAEAENERLKDAVAEERERAAEWCDVLQHDDLSLNAFVRGAVNAALQEAAEAIRSGELP